MAKDAFAEEAGKGTPAPVAETKTCTARIVEQAEENEASRIESAFNRRQSTARETLGRAGLSVAVGTPGGIAFHHASHLLDTMDSVLCLTLLTFAVLTAWDKFCRSLRMKASKVVRALAPEKVCGVKREVDSFFKRLDNELEIRQKS
jgi:cobalamin biosynthesis protein CobD/CbiB